MARPARVDMRTLLIVGSSQTVVAQRPDGPVAYTPRRYPEALAGSTRSGQDGPGRELP